MEEAIARETGEVRLLYEEFSSSRSAWRAVLELQAVRLAGRCEGLIMRLVGLVAGEVGECISALGVRFAEVTTAMGVSTTATSVAGGVVDTGCLMGVVGGCWGGGGSGWALRIGGRKWKRLLVDGAMFHHY